MTGDRPRHSRKEIRAFADELEAWLRSTYRLDPTGVTAVRNVARGAR